MKKFVSLFIIMALAISACLAEETIAPNAVYGGEIEITEISETSEPVESSAAFIPEGLEPLEPAMNILGADDRITVYNTSKYPYSAICYIKTGKKCGCESTGTGFMVSKNCLMTASHCMICTKHNQGLDWATFYFGYDGNGGYFYKYNDKFTYWTGTGFPNGYNWEAEQNDYAYIRFNSNVGDYTGWFGLTALNDRDTNNGWFCLTGYKGGEMKYNWGRCTVYNSNISNFSMDSQPGNSGCPIYDSDYYVSSICVAGSKDGTSNSSYRITGSLIEKMRNNGMFS